MPFDETLRRDIVARHAQLYRAALFGSAEDTAAAELADLGAAYEECLPRLAFGRCPISGEVQLHSFDPFGLDGPWWNCEAPARPLLERILSCIAVTGAVALSGPPASVPWLCRPGPGAPYVLPRLLECDGVFATIRELPVGPHTAWAICYFAASMPDVALPNDWGCDWRWDAGDGAPGWSSHAEEVGERDFTLSPWIARGKLFWIAPGDDTLTLRTEVAGCPFVALPGERREQRIAFGRLSLDDGDAPAPALAAPAFAQIIGEFALIELDEGLREELRLPPVPVPVRLSARNAAFPPGGAVRLAVLLGEVEAFIAANPQVLPAYAPLQAALGLTAGMAEAERGDHAAALSCYDCALKAAPDSVALRSHRALALHAMGRFPESREAMEALVRAMPRGQVLPLVWMLLARRLVEDGEPDKARTLVDELGQFGGQDEAVARFGSLLDGGGPPAAMPPTPLAAPAPEPVDAPVPELVPEPVDAASTPSSTLPTNAAAPDDETARISHELPGIWAPEQGGCATGFGFAFTPGGRYAEGDEYMGEEGRWEVSGGHLIETVERVYAAADEVSRPRITPTKKRYDYRIIELTASRLVLANGEAEMAFVRCPDGRRVFTDGAVFPE